LIGNSPADPSSVKKRKKKKKTVTLDGGIRKKERVELFFSPTSQTLIRGKIFSY